MRHESAVDRVNIQPVNITSKHKICGTLRGISVEVAPATMVHTLSRVNAMEWKSQQLSLISEG